MKETVKCQACGHEWNQRSESPTRQCPECHTRNWERIDSLGAVVSGAVVSDNEAVVTPAVVTLKTKTVAGWRDSVAAPGMYKVCVAHGMRYCKPCESEKPMKGTGRWCPECDWRAKAPADMPWGGGRPGSPWGSPSWDRTNDDVYRSRRGGAAPRRQAAPLQRDY